MLVFMLSVLAATACNGAYAASCDGKTRLEALVQVAETQHATMGILFTNSLLLPCKAGGAMEYNTIPEAASAITRGSYSSRMDDHVHLVSPADVNAGAYPQLSVVIEDFQTESPATLQALSNLLWMNLQAALNPDHGGFAGNYPGPAFPKQLPPLKFTNATVQTLLDLLVTKHGSAIWIAFPVRNLRDAPRSKLWSVLEYDPQNPLPIDKLCCLSKQQMR